jgi:glucose/arabinose dehydrogenase
MLITERPGRLRLLKNGVLDPTPISGVPVVKAQRLSGLMDVALHPKFAENHFVYLTYNKGRDDGMLATVLARGRLEGSALKDVKDLFVAEPWWDGAGGSASRIVFGRDGMLYMTTGSSGGPAGGEGQDTSAHKGKILRLRDDGTAPPDNPFVGKPGYKPYIFSMGHRNQLGLAINPYTGEVWSGEQGPNGGDEVNVIRAGRNYGWPFVSDGRDYRGHYLTPTPYREGMERPHVLWVPSIALSGMAFYTGDRFPNWRRNLFVGGMREGEIARTGQLVRIVFNDNWDELRRESLLRDLHQRIRDVRQGPDGLLYVITDEDAAALLKIEPVD